jgi:hypothetical protein
MTALRVERARASRWSPYDSIVRANLIDEG